MTDALHPIQLAARLTGLTTHVIRIWEQRYQAIEPSRTPSNHRLYTRSDLERLVLLRDVTRAGHSISQMARLSNEDLRSLTVNARTPEFPARSTSAAALPEALQRECMACVHALDGPGLDGALNRAATALGAQGMLHRVVGPLTQRLGDLRREGRISAAHEHLATGHIRAFLANLAKPFGGNDAAPALVVATPAGQMHEMGALLAGALAANLGWQAIHLGASLPAFEIAGVALEKRARAVALSIVYPEDDPNLPGELARLHEALPAETKLLAGGRAATAYHGVLQRIGAVVVEDLVQFGHELDRLRKPGREAGR